MISPQKITDKVDKLVEIHLERLQVSDMGGGTRSASTGEDFRRHQIEGHQTEDNDSERSDADYVAIKILDKEFSAQDFGLLDPKPRVRNSIRCHVGDADVAAVPCGLGRAIVNKGAVAIRMRVYGRLMCFVNCHFSAQLEVVNRRNADFDHVYRTMVFSRPSIF